MNELAPHAGCNWKGCRECFPRPDHQGNELMSKHGSMARPNVWQNPPRAYPNSTASVGIPLEKDSDFVSVELPDGRQVNVYGDGQIWVDSNFFTLDDEDINWR